MKKLVLALSAACLTLGAIAATLALLSGADDAQSAGPVPSVPVKTDGETPTFELWFIGDSHGPCCTVRSVSRTAEELGITHVGTDFAVGPHLIATLVEALLAGPSPKEAALGFGSPRGADSRLGLDPVLRIGFDRESPPLANFQRANNLNADGVLGGCSRAEGRHRAEVAACGHEIRRPRRRTKGAPGASPGWRTLSPRNIEPVPAKGHALAPKH